MFTAADLQGVVGVMRGAGPDGLRTPSFGPLASDRVRFVGDPVALVVASSRSVAEDACELVEVRYDPLPVLADTDTAVAPGAPAIFDEVGHNVMFEGHWVYGEPDAMFARAERHGRWRFSQHRQCNAPLEGRAGLVDHSPDTGDLTYHAAHQNPHGLRLFVAELLGIPAHRFHVRTDDVGGSFGQKAYVSREDVAVCAAGVALGRPVKWIEDRLENLQAAGQAREERFDVEAAYDADGTVRAVRVAMVFDQGAYQLTTLPPTIFPTIVRVLFPGAYRLRDLEFDVKVVATNKATYVAYRGPWEAETFVRERMLDEIAADIGLPPEVVRRRNLLTSDEFPTRLATDVSFAHVTARETFEAAMARADPDGFRRDQEQARGGGALPGLRVRHVRGALSRSTGLHPGARRGRRAPERAAGDRPPRARRLADRLHQPVAPRPGPPHHAGATGRRRARSATRGGPHRRRRHPGDAVQPGRDRRQPRRDAGQRCRDRRRRQHPRAGRPGSPPTCSKPTRPTSKSSTAPSPYAACPPRAGPSETSPTSPIAPPRSSRPAPPPASRRASTSPSPRAAGRRRRTAAGSRSTRAPGRVAIDRYLVVEDCGALINPTIVEGQIAGGVAQGIGGVLYERAVYDENGQLLTSTLADYLLPTSAEIPPIEIHHLESAPQGALDFRGVGEGGAIGAPAALCNAVADALRPFGAEVLEQHLPPTRILELIGAITAPAH